MTLNDFSCLMLTLKNQFLSADFQPAGRSSGISEELSSEEDMDAMGQRILSRRSVEGAPSINNSENQSRKPAADTNQSVAQVSVCVTDRESWILITAFRA